MVSKIFSGLDVQRIIIKDFLFKNTSSFLFFKCLDELQFSERNLI